MLLLACYIIIALILIKRRAKNKNNYQNNYFSLYPPIINNELLHLLTGNGVQQIADRARFHPRPSILVLKPS